MSDEYSQPTLELSRTFEGWWLPRRPLCCDDDYAALRRRSRADALRCKHIEANPSALVNTIVVDIDDANAKAMACGGTVGCCRTGSRRTRPTGTLTRAGC